MIEPVEGLKTAWGWPHNKIGEENEIFYIDEPGWIALVHDQNTTTYLWGERVSTDEKRAVLTEFSVRKPPYAYTRLRRAEALGRRLARVGRRLARYFRSARESDP